MKKDFGTVLKKLRASHHLNQTQMAELMGVSKVAYGQYEQGKHSPSIEKFALLCENFDIAFWDIFDKPQESKNTIDLEILDKATDISLEVQKSLNLNLNDKQKSKITAMIYNFIVKKGSQNQPVMASDIIPLVEWAV